MFLSSRRKAMLGRGMMLVQAIAALPGLAAEPPPLDDTALNETTTGAPQQVREESGPPSRKRTRPIGRSDGSGEVARIVQTAGTERPNTIGFPDVIVLNPKSDTPGLPGASQITTNLVISATVSDPANAIRP